MARRKKARGEGGKRMGTFSRRSRDPASILGWFTPLWAESWRPDLVSRLPGHILRTLAEFLARALLVPAPAAGGASSTATTLCTNMIISRSDPRWESVTESAREPSWRRPSGRPGHAWMCSEVPPPDPKSMCTVHLPSVVSDPSASGLTAWERSAGPPR